MEAARRHIHMSRPGLFGSFALVALWGALLLLVVLIFGQLLLMLLAGATIE